MAFTPRTFTEILNDMMAYVKSRTSISDFNVGSVIRTILEAAALEDDEQYFQMVQLLDLFSISTATGEYLDRRMADFNLARQPAKAAFGTVKFFNNNLISDQSAIDASSGSTTIRVFDISQFPLSGFPYNIRIGEGSTRVQDASVTAVSTSTNEFTLSSGLSFSIEVGDRISLIDGAQSYTINPGVTILAPATTVEGSKTYETRESAFIAAGNRFSNEVVARAVAAGDGFNTSANRVTSFSGSPPFTGAGVINTSSMEGGVNRESDREFRRRGLRKLQALSRGTPLALRSESVGVVDPATGQRTTTANLIEHFVNDEVVVYIDDGTGFSPDTEILSQNSLAAVPSGSLLQLNDASNFPSNGFVLIEDEELLEYVTKTSTNGLVLGSSVTGSHTSGDIVRFVDIVSSSAETGQRRFNLTNFPVVRGTELIFTKASGASTWTQLIRDTDYVLNKGTGEFIIVDEAGLSSGTEVVANYDYYVNLISEVQKVLEGSEEDPVVYPGIKAAGIFLSVEAPTVVAVTVRLNISGEESFTEENLAPQVRSEVESYISSLKIGDDVILSKIIDAAHNVVGVKSVKVVVPNTDIVVLENELPVPFDNNGDSLITVL